MKSLESGQTDKQTDYCNPLAHAPRVNKLKTVKHAETLKQAHISAILTDTLRPAIKKMTYNGIASP